MMETSKTTKYNFTISGIILLVIAYIFFNVGIELGHWIVIIFKN